MIAANEAQPLLSSEFIYVIQYNAGIHTMRGYLWFLIWNMNGDENSLPSHLSHYSTGHPPLRPIQTQTLVLHGTQLVRIPVVLCPLSYSKSSL